MARSSNELTGVTNAPVTDADGRLIVVGADGSVTLPVKGVPETVTVTSSDAFGNPLTWTQDGVDYVATYDANGFLLTQGPA